MLAASLLEIRRLRGVLRPAIAVVIPSRKGPSVLLDCGANADSRPEHLRQFAEMGAIFAEEILGTENPEVRLLSIGEEAEKGDQLDDRGAPAAGELDLNSEATSRAAGCSRAPATSSSAAASRETCALKLLEGTILSVFDGLRTEIGGTTRGKLGGFLIRPAARRLRSRFDPEARSAAPICSVSGARRHRARQLLAACDRERDPACSARRRARRRTKLGDRLEPEAAGGPC